MWKKTGRMNQRGGLKKCFQDLPLTKLTACWFLKWLHRELWRNKEHYKNISEQSKHSTLIGSLSPCFRSDILLCFSSLKFKSSLRSHSLMAIGQNSSTMQWRTLFQAVSSQEKKRKWNQYSRFVFNFLCSLSWCQVHRKIQSSANYEQQLKSH